MTEANNRAYTFFGRVLPERVLAEIAVDDFGLKFSAETSIHLRFDPRQPLAREIASYQKHRVKRLRQQPL